jgi:hypothetical protein
MYNDNSTDTQCVFIYEHNCSKFSLDAVLVVLAVRGALFDLGSLDIRDVLFVLVDV